MSSPAACKRKIRYPSMAKARHASVDLRERWARDLEPYRCTVCGGFHLTRTSPEQMKRGLRVEVTEGEHAGRFGRVMATKRSGHVEVQFEGQPYIFWVEKSAVRLAKP